MSKYLKGLLEAELAEKFAEVSEFMVFSTLGLDGNTNNELRGVLKEKGIKMTVVRNAMMRRALAKNGLDSAISLFGAGPCTVVYGGDNIVDVAKEMAQWAKKVDGVTVRAAFTDGTVFDEEAAKELAKMPSKAELQGTIVIIANSPGSTVAGTVTGVAGRIAGCIKTLVEKLEEAA